MKKLLVALLAVGCGGSCLAAGSLSAEAGLAYINVSGVRPYAATGASYNNETPGVLAPFIRYTYSLPRWDFSAGYAYIGNLKWQGFSLTPDIFHESAAPVATVTAFGAAERIHDLSLDARYVLTVREGVTFAAGPTVSVFYSRAKIAGRAFSDTEVNLGASARLKVRLTERSSLGLGYRYSAPTDRRLNTATLDWTLQF